jgi:hypothetical protein
MANRDIALPSRSRIKRALELRVVDIEQHLLHDLPAGAKISLTLDCWTSPNKLSFMAINGYFINAKWEYREVMLGFEGLEGKHSGANLSNVLCNILQKQGIEKRILAVTTDNASNNRTLTKELEQALNLGSFQAKGNHIPCLAHVLQLSLKELLGKIRIEPRNDNVQLIWQENELDQLDHAKGISKMLGKVSPKPNDLSNDPGMPNYTNTA